MTSAGYDSQHLKQERLKNLQAEMKRMGIGACFLGEGLNVKYVLDVLIPGGRVFVPREGAAIALVRPRDMPYVKLTHPDVELTYYHQTEAWRPGFESKIARFVEGMTGYMSRAGVRDLPLAVDQLDPTALLALDRAGVQIIDSLPVVEFARSVKTSDEVEIYRTLGKQYSQVFTLFRDNVRPGITEKQLQAMVVGAWQEVGGDDILQINVCSGQNMNPWRRWATDRPLQEGEFVGIDFHGRSPSGLLGDTSRTYLVGGNPSPEQRDLYKRAWEYVHGVADAVRAGRTHADVVELVPPVLEKYQQQHDNYHIVHSVGMVPQGYPKLDRLRVPDDDTFKENQILAIECFFAEVGSDTAVKLEEMILVHDGPAEFITGGVPYESSIIG